MQIRGSSVTDRDVLLLEWAERLNEGSPQARTWERAQLAFENWRPWSSFYGPHCWHRLTGMERAIWYDMIEILDADQAARAGPK